MLKINQNLAQQIVDSSKAVVGWDVNFMDRHGRIIASTDEERIGMYHKAAHEAVKSRTLQVVEVDDCETRRGVNYPVFMNNQVVGVIGITGDPAVVRRYGRLLTKICEAFLRDYRLRQDAFDEQEQRSHLVLSLLYGDKEILTALLEQDESLASQRFITVLFHLGSQGLGSEEIKDRLFRDFEDLGLLLYAYIYPDNIVCLVGADLWDDWQKQTKGWQQRFVQQLKMGLGTWEYLEHMPESYRLAKLALKTAEQKNVFSLRAEEMKLEFLLQSLPSRVRRRYREDVLHTLNEEERELLRLYFEKNQSLKETADCLHIHKNTLQYRLNKIEAETGLDPRNFHDAVSLYIAVIV